MIETLARLQFLDAEIWSKESGEARRPRAETRTHVPGRRKSIALRSPCFAQAQGVHPWPPVRRMRLTHGGCGRTFLRFCNPAARIKPVVCRSLANPARRMRRALVRTPRPVSSGSRLTRSASCSACKALLISVAIRACGFTPETRHSPYPTGKEKADAAKRGSVLAHQEGPVGPVSRG